jgi:T5orf172 domain
MHGEGRDIFERLYAVRLDHLRAQPDCVQLLKDLDHQGLLSSSPAGNDKEPSKMDDDALLAALGVEPGGAGGGVAELKHVRPLAERRASDDVAVRHPCQDFASFEPIFAAVKTDLAEGTRQTRRFERKSEIEPGRFFIVEGLTAYVAEADEAFVNESGNRDQRLRVIFDNGTESNLLARSLQKALTQGPAGRRITEPNAGPLFDEEIRAEGSETGTIYVLRSQSHHPAIAENRDVIHKIGVTGGEVEKRFANAEKDPTFLMASVELVATFRLFDIDRAALENLLHRFFAAAM